MPEHSIGVDIKEAVLLSGTVDVGDSIDKLHHAGIRLAVEDFGTGYSSMTTLKKYALDYIKINPSLVHDMALDQDSRSSTEAMIAMAHKLGIKVMAEGIETLAQRGAL